MSERREDWPTLRSEYIEGIVVDGTRRYPTLEDVSQRNGLHPSTVRKKAAEEHWTDERVAFQQRVEQTRQHALMRQIGEMGADFDVASMRAARAGMSIVSARLSELGTLAQLRIEGLRAVEQGNADPTTIRIPPPPPYEEVARLARAASDWYDLGTRARGDIPFMGGASIDVDSDDEPDAERDERTERVVGILIDAGVLIPHGDDDDRPRMALAVAGNGSGAAGNGHGAADDEVHPADPDEG